MAAVARAARAARAAWVESSAALAYMAADFAAAAQTVRAKADGAVQLELGILEVAARAARVARAVRVAKAESPTVMVVTEAALVEATWAEPAVLMVAAAVAVLVRGIAEMAAWLGVTVLVGQAVEAAVRQATCSSSSVPTPRGHCHS